MQNQVLTVHATEIYAVFEPLVRFVIANTSKEIKESEKSTSRMSNNEKCPIVTFINKIN